MKINHFLDSTYLKTSEQANISKEETLQIITSLVQEAIKNQFKLVMIRPQYILIAKEMIRKVNSDVLVGTVIGFHEGTNAIEDKLKEANNAISDGVDELDFVINYKAFLDGKINLVKSEIFKGTKLAFENNKTIKWIIEIAALSDIQIITITQLIRDVVLDKFGEENAKKVFVKSSTGFYKTIDNKPNGATLEAMQLIVSNASPLPAKAAGGVRTYQDAVKMINLGVTRIGTSSAKTLINNQQIKDKY